MSELENELRWSTRTDFVRKDLPPPRPRMAANVVCMFRDARPPVQQVRRGGRYPKTVALLRRERARRYFDDSPKPHSYKIGDRVDVRCNDSNDSQWLPAIILRNVETDSDGMKRFRLLCDGKLFQFEDSLDMYCLAWESALRPA